MHACAHEGFAAQVLECTRPQAFWRCLSCSCVHVHMCTHTDTCAHMCVCSRARCLWQLVASIQGASQWKPRQALDRSKNPEDLCPRAVGH